MEDFTLTISGGFPAQEVIVGGDYSLAAEDFSPDISHYVSEEVIFEDIDSGFTSSSDDLNPLSAESHDEDDLVDIKEELLEEEEDDLELNLDLSKVHHKKIVFKNKEFVFVTEDGKTAECFEEDIESTKTEVQNQFTKPKMSYAQLIAEALLTGVDRMLTLNDIYIAINKKHPYYSLDAASGRNWQNAIRHNLTLNKAFIKVPRPATEGRGAYWKLEDGAEGQIFRRMARNYSRPKTISLSRHNIIYCDNSDIKTVYIAVPSA